MEPLSAAPCLKASFLVANCELCLVLNPVVASPGAAVSKPRRLSLVRPVAVQKEKESEIHVLQQLKFVHTRTRTAPILKSYQLYIEITRIHVFVLKRSI